MTRHLIRNVFDQYHQPENRLTHALIHVLAQNRRLTSQFIRRFASQSNPPRGTTYFFSCQSLPGDDKPQSDEEDYVEQDSLPDAWIYDERGRWAVVLECKVTAGLRIDQLRRHISRARKEGYDEAHLLVITAHEQEPQIVKKLRIRISCSWVNWSDIYEFFDQHSGSHLESEFVNYLRVLEGRLMADGYEGPPLTKFTGIPFGPNDSYKEREAKVVLRALRANLLPQLAASKILPKIDESTPPRPMTGTWFMVRFRFASGQDFTKHPHLTVALTMGEPDWKQFGSVWIQLVLPHNAKSEYWKRIRNIKKERLDKVLADVADRIRSWRRRKERDIWEPKLTLQLHQRHFYAHTQWTRDGLLQFDLDTLLNKGHRASAGVKRVPAWFEAAKAILAQSHRANFELALQARFPLSDQSISRCAGLVDAMAKSAEAFQPFLALLRNEDLETTG